MQTNATFRPLPAFALALLFTAATAFGQAPKKLYSTVYYHKLKPGHTFAEARAMENEFKKIHQYQADQGTLSGWYMLAVELTSNPNKEYDYVTINTFSDPAYIENPYSKATMEKVMGADYQTKTSDLYKRMGELKEVAKFEIWEQKAYAGPTTALSPDKAPIWLINGIKVKSGQETEYASRANKLTPMYQDLVNQGKGSAWIFSALAYPSADESSYNFSSVILLPDVKSLLNEPNTEDAFKKAMPGVDRKQFYTELDDIRKFNRQEVYYLVEYAVKGAATAQASK